VGFQDSFLERVSVSEFTEYNDVPVQFVYCTLSTKGYLVLDASPLWRKELKGTLPRAIRIEQQGAVEISAADFRK
jgi:hypothetical protein